jgi:hypothetical protein
MADKDFPPLVTLTEMAAREGWFIDPKWTERVLAEDDRERKARRAKWRKFYNNEPLPTADQRELERRVEAWAWLERYLNVA